MQWKILTGRNTKQRTANKLPSLQIGDIKFQRSGWKCVRLAATEQVLNSCAASRLGPTAGTKDTYRNRLPRRILPLFLDDSQNAIGITGTDGHSPLTHS